VVGLASLRFFCLLRPSYFLVTLNVYNSLQSGMLPSYAPRLLKAQRFYYTPYPHFRRISPVPPVLHALHSASLRIAWAHPLHFQCVLVVSFFRVARGMCVPSLQRHFILLFSSCRWYRAATFMDLHRALFWFSICFVYMPFRELISPPLHAQIQLVFSSRNFTKYTYHAYIVNIILQT